MNVLTILIRFLIIFILSLIFGLERQKSHKPIGFGTFIFVSVGSCGLAITAIILNTENPLPLLAAIITGIGFLGAGALIKTTDKIFGFTSAASIWIFSIIGLVIGLGEYFIGFLIYGLMWLAILVDKLLERKGIGSYQKRLEITANRNVHIDEVQTVLRTRKFKIVSIDIDKKASNYRLTLLIEGTKVDLNMFPKRLYKTDWVDSFKIE